MKVSLDIPDRAWADLLKVAEDQETTVALLVEAAIRDAIRDAIRPSHLTKLRAEARKLAILAAHREGLTDASIAERTGELRGYVANVRRAADLPPNDVRTGTRRTSHHPKRAARKADGRKTP